MEDCSYLLKVTDEIVALLQKLITTLGTHYEKELKTMNMASFPSSFGPNLESVQLAYHILNEMLASLWPCEKKFVAVFGPTGSGKSTLLNILLSMMCSAAKEYENGIRFESSRAVLRETTKSHSFSQGPTKGAIQVEQEGEETIQVEHDDDLPDGEETIQVQHLMEAANLKSNEADSLENEWMSFTALLGLCCAENRKTYLTRHLPQYDRSPFLLQNGRLGDAGTTKVTAIEYGPKFTGFIQWTSKKRLRKNFRDLRHMLESKDHTEGDDKKLAELKEFWDAMLKLSNLDSKQGMAVFPDESQINRLISQLGKIVPLQKEERLQTSVTKGCIMDRVFVRNCLKTRLCNQLGQLAEDIRIEVPVPSFEGGVSLLDVPGTNDPRVLHQRETRDAIDQTSLILLVLDKSVIDESTNSVLAESPLLERMILDKDAQCNLVVVGIVEKGGRNNLTSRELIDNFDPKNVLRTSLRKVFNTMTRRLISHRRIDKELAVKRIIDLFADTERICVIPVLPLLCASIHLSASNPTLHKVNCELKCGSGCVLNKSREDIMLDCLETNIPKLLEKVYLVRLPPTVKGLLDQLERAINLLTLLTEDHTMDRSFVKFLRRERNHAKSIKAESLTLSGFPDGAINEGAVDEVLEMCKNECLMTKEEDIQCVKNCLHNMSEVARHESRMQMNGFHLGPLIMKGFRPEIIGARAQQLIKPIDGTSKQFVNSAFKALEIARRGEYGRYDTSVAEVLSPERCIDLQSQVESSWEMALNRLRAKHFCGGIDGGLLGAVRKAFRKAYDQSLKGFFRQLRQEGNGKEMAGVVERMLLENKAGVLAARIARQKVINQLNLFWEKLNDAVAMEVSSLWRSWQDEIGRLAGNARHANLRIFVQVVASCCVHDDILRGKVSAPAQHHDGRRSGGMKEELLGFQESLKEKKGELQSLLDGCKRSASEDPHYGYSLLQRCLLFDFIHNGDGTFKKEVGVSLNPSKIDLNKDNSIKKTTLGMSKEGVGGLARPCIPRVGRGLATLQRPPSINQRAEKEKASISLDELPRSLESESSMNPPPIVNKLGSCNQMRRKAVLLNEFESHKLQKRDHYSKKKPTTPKS